MDWLQAIRLYSTERRDEVLAEDPDFVFPEDSLDAKPTAATLAAVAEFRRSRRWRRNG